MRLFRRCKQFPKRVAFYPHPPGWIGWRQYKHFFLPALKGGALSKHLCMVVGWILRSTRQCLLSCNVHTITVVKCPNTQYHQQLVCRGYFSPYHVGLLMTNSTLNVAVYYLYQEQLINYAEEKLGGNRKKFFLELWGGEAIYDERCVAKALKKALKVELINNKALKLDWMVFVWVYDIILLCCINDRKRVQRG